MTVSSTWNERTLFAVAIFHIIAGSLGLILIPVSIFTPETRPFNIEHTFTYLYMLLFGIMAFKYCQKAKQLQRI